MSNRKTPRSFAMSDEHMEMLEAIRKNIGASWKSEALMYTIITTYKKLFPAYTIQRDTDSSNAVSPQEKARLKFEAEQEKKKLEQNEKEMEKRDICIEVLNGSVEEKDGVKYCVWTNHDTRNDYHQKAPLMGVSKQYANGKWVPTKEAVLKARPELKKVYGIKKTSKRDTK